VKHACLQGGFARGRGPRVAVGAAGLKGNIDPGSNRCNATAPPPKSEAAPVGSSAAAATQ
jgi:hypothetical protein